MLLALGICLAFAACGGEDEGDPIPANTAAALQQELDNVQGRLDNGSSGACRDILEGPRGPNLERVQQLLDSLPEGVDADVRSALEQSFSNLWSLVESECEQRAQQEEEARQEEEPEVEPEPVPTETETVPTETVPPEEEPVPPEEEVLPPEGDGDNEGEIPGDPGGGVGPGNNGNGNGNAFGQEGDG